MTPQEAFNIAREFDPYAVTGNRDNDGGYQSVLLTFHEAQVVFLRINAMADVGSVTAFVFNEAPNVPRGVEFTGDDALWLAAVLSMIQSTNPMELTNAHQPA